MSILKCSKQVFPYVLIFSLIWSCQDKDEVIPNSPSCEDATVNIICDRPPTDEVNSLLQYLTKYSPNSLAIMDYYLNSCQSDQEPKIPYIKSFIQPSDSSKPIQLDTLNSFSLIIHEVIHAINSSYISAQSSVCENESMEIYWQRGQSPITVDAHQLFSVNEIAPDLSDLFKQYSSFQHKYILTEKLKEYYRGAYWYLDEWNAYLQGGYTTYELYEAFANISTDEALNTYVTLVENNLIAYYEFRHFIWLFLSYAEKHHSDKFEKVKSNTAFWEVYDHVEKDYLLLIKKHLDRLNTDKRLKKFSFYEENYQTFYAKATEETNAIKKRLRN